MSEILFKCKIIVPKHGIKKNGKMIRKNWRTGQRFIGSNPKAQALENQLTQKFLIEKLKQRVETITTDINAKFTFYFPKSVYFTKKGHRNKNLPDLSNLIETPQDALQEARILFDDNLICSLDGSSRQPIDDNNYWLEVELTSI